MEIYNPKKYLSKFTHSEFKSLKDYEKVYNSSIENPTKFWADVASSNLDWFKKWNSVYEGDFSKGESKWFSGAQLNLCYNAIDRHLNSGLSQKTALIWEGDNPQEQRQLSYQELFNLVCKISNALKKIGVKKGDRVSLYLPMIPELAASVLACARIGAIHSVIFAGFSSHSIRDRILDADSHWVITCNGTFRNGKYLSLKDKVDEALKECPCVEKVLIFERSQNSMQIDEEKDILFSQLEPNLSSECEAEKMESEDPLFILYTSGSTGKPKGVLHTTAGYGLYTAFTSKHVFNLQKNDVYFCTADIGWITGHSYLVYGPLINAATCVMFEGVPTYPSGSRFWEMIDRYQVSIFYTSPTAIRSLMRLGEDLVNKSNLKSLRLLGSVGEPINPEAWRWYYKNIGKENCPIVDTWWQTETGGILLSPLPAVTPLKPGSATLPFLGIQPVLLNEKGEELTGEAEGLLCIKSSWPSITRGVFRNPERFLEGYFKMFPGYYFTGDGCRRDKDGYYWITGRVDDVINVSGHRLSTAEIESAIVLHPEVAEAAVVGVNHEVKGQAVYAFVSLKDGKTPNENLKKEIIDGVAREISPIAKPEYVQWASALPKTRSGKIMRRILRKIVHKEFDSLGDTSTLADPHIIDDLKSNLDTRL